MMKTLLLPALLLMAIHSGYACDEHGKTGFVAENDMWIGVHNKSRTNSMTKEKFDEVIDTITDLYKSEAHRFGKRLDVKKLWDNGKVNAAARPTRRTMEVYMFGGLARFPTITPDGLALAFCHELGHHMGGAPQKIVNHEGRYYRTWASNEGQADYWGTMKCLRKYFEYEDDNKEVLAAMDIPAKLKRDCKKSWRSKKDYRICLRVGMAGYSVASMFNELRKITTPVKFTNSDKRKVRTTFHGHPMPQCRLDTYFAGATCKADAFDDVDFDDPSVNTCTRQNGDALGVRPLCWFNPGEYGLDS